MQSLAHDTFHSLLVLNAASVIKITLLAIVQPVGQKYNEQHRCKCFRSYLREYANTSLRLFLVRKIPHNLL